MSRTLWFAAGVGASVFAMNKARRLRESFTVDGLKDRAAGLATGAMLFREEVARGQVAKEFELRERLGLVPVDTQELEAPAAQPRSTTEETQITTSRRTLTDGHR